MSLIMTFEGRLTISVQLRPMLDGLTIVYELKKRNKVHCSRTLSLSAILKVTADSIKDVSEPRALAFLVSIDHAQPIVSLCSNSDRTYAAAASGVLLHDINTALKLLLHEAPGAASCKTDNTDIPADQQHAQKRIHTTFNSTHITTQQDRLDTRRVVSETDCKEQITQQHGRLETWRGLPQKLSRGAAGLCPHLCCTWTSCHGHCCC